MKLKLDKFIGCVNYSIKMKWSWWWSRSWRGDNKKKRSAITFFSLAARRARHLTNFFFSNSLRLTLVMIIDPANTQSDHRKWEFQRLFFVCRMKWRFENAFLLFAFLIFSSFFLALSCLNGLMCWHDNEASDFVYVFVCVLTTMNEWMDERTKEWMETIGATTSSKSEFLVCRSTSDDTTSFNFAWLLRASFFFSLAKNFNQRLSLCFKMSSSFALILVQIHFKYLRNLFFSLAS